VPGDVDADIGHGLDGMGIELGWLRAGAYNVDAISEDAAGQAFRHLAAGRVCDAKEEDIVRDHPVF
jgi:hypothetical protein